MTALLDTLRAIVGDGNVLTGDAVSARAAHFWNPLPLQAKALVRPANTAEVSAIMRACHASGQAVVTHGGLTGLVEGDRSTATDLVLSMERMRQIEAIDVVGRTLTAQAGCVLETVQKAAAESDLQFGLDLGARGSCTIGGNIATNAGGLSVLRYGMMREQVLGLEVVLADGRVMSSMNHMMKNNAGYDLKHMFVGSEGTLAVITRAVLRLRAATPSVQTCLLAFENYTQVTRALRHVDSALNGQLNAFEVIWQPFFQLNTDPELEGTVTAPMSREHAIYAIVESRGSGQQADYDTFERAMQAVLEQGLIADAVIPQSESARATIWEIREALEVSRRHHPLFGYDVSLPIVDMADYLGKIEKQVRQVWPQAAFYAYGHLADGNLHVTIAPHPENYGKPADRSNNHDLHQWHLQCNDIVYAPLAEIGGSVSAEHGIGLAKKNYLKLSRSPAEIALMQQLKNMLDPSDILNPGKIL